MKYAVNYKQLGGSYPTEITFRLPENIKVNKSEDEQYVDLIIDGESIPIFKTTTPAHQQGLDTLYDLFSRKNITDNIAKEILKAIIVVSDNDYVTRQIYELYYSKFYPNEKLILDRFYSTSVCAPTFSMRTGRTIGTSVPPISVLTTPGAAPSSFTSALQSLLVAPLSSTTPRISTSQSVLKPPQKEFVIFNYPSGFIYKGEWENNRPDGRGKLYFGNILKYNGEWLEGKEHGNGTTYYDNGHKDYEGEWKNGKEHGNGTKYNDNGIITYKGEFVNGKPEGKGRAYFENTLRLRYDGDWIDGKENGKGKTYHLDKLVYDGDLLEGKKHGKGKGITYYDLRDRLDFEVYEGDWVNNMKYGFGKSTYKDLMWLGEWKNNLKNGRNQEFKIDQGNLVLIYDGEWVNNKKQGRAYYFDGSLYDGEVETIDGITRPKNP